MGERHFGECLWLVVLQSMSSVLATEKETPRQKAFASNFSKSSWRQWILPQYKRKAAVRGSRPHTRSSDLEGC